MKSDRLLSALLLLQAYGRLPGRELAERLEVSPRTVHRDMEALSAAGVPVFAMRGSRGGWQLDEQWRAKVPGLDEAELRALLLAQPRVMGGAHLELSGERAIVGEARFIVLGLGAGAEVLEPASLRESIAAEVSLLFQRRQTLNSRHADM
jgi:predicted DNA-binding transcriptional regulator YafY